MSNGYCGPGSAFLLSDDPNCPGMGPSGSGGFAQFAFYSEGPSGGQPLPPYEPSVTELEHQITQAQIAAGAPPPPPDIFIGYVAPFVPQPSAPAPPVFSPTGSAGPTYGPNVPLGDPLPPIMPGDPNPFYQAPPPPDETAPFPVPPVGGTLGLGLLGFGVLGIEASLYLGAPAPDEYGTGDIEALIASGFYDAKPPAVIPSPLVPQYQPPDLPSQIELAPAVAPQLEPAPGEPGSATNPLQGPVIEVPRVAPVEYVVPNPVFNPVGLPYPAGVPSPFPEARPVGAPAAAPFASPQPFGLPLQSPAPANQPVAGTVPTTGSLLGPVTAGVPQPTSQPQPQPQEKPGPSPAIGQGTVVNTDMQATPASSLARLSTDKSGCDPNQQRKKQDKKKRKERAECWMGTYRELKSGLIKHRKERIPCR